VLVILDLLTNGRKTLLQMTDVRRKIAWKLYLGKMVVRKVDVANTVSLNHIVYLDNFRGVPLPHHQLRSVKLDHWIDPKEKLDKVEMPKLPFPIEPRQN
jgi:hypothetical protein